MYLIRSYNEFNCIIHEMVNQTRLKILTITTEFSEWYDVIITPSRERERERERGTTHNMRAASERNLRCSSVVDPLRSVLTATGVGPVPCPRISRAEPWYTSPNSPLAINLVTKKKSERCRL